MTVVATCSLKIEERAGKTGRVGWRRHLKYSELNSAQYKRMKMLRCVSALEILEMSEDDKGCVTLTLAKARDASGNQHEDA